MVQLNIQNDDKKPGITIKEDGIIVDDDGRKVPAKDIKEAIEWLKKSNKKSAEK